MIKYPHISVTGVSKIKTYTFQGGYDGGAYSAVIAAESHTVNIGDFVSIYLWYGNNSPIKNFTGYVKQISYSVPDGLYTITIYDVLIRAVDYFIASSTPDSAYKIKNISAEDLVGDVLEMAGITNYGYEETHFTFGVYGEGEVNLTGAYDFIHGVADLLAWHIYADKNGKVWFVDRKPYVVSGDTPVKTITKFLRISPYTKSDRDLRNRIVVYGNGVYAEAEASSPYLPSGFYKSVVLSSPYIDSQSFAQDAANYNLDKLNRLTEEITISIEGDPELYPLQVIALDLDGYEYLDGDWLIYSMNTRFGNGGFIQDIILRR